MIELIKLASNSKTRPDTIAQLGASFDEWFPLYEIITPNRIAAFISQAAIETCYFNYFTELGNKEYFQKYEPNTSIGKILGNKFPGDGYKYRGRGIFQLTGRANHVSFGKRLGVDLENHPELGAEIPLATHIACQFWKDRRLNSYADTKDIKEITRRINGGMNAYDKRKNMFDKLLGAGGNQN